MSTTEIKGRLYDVEETNYNVQRKSFSLSLDSASTIADLKRAVETEHGSTLHPDTLFVKIRLGVDQKLFPDDDTQKISSLQWDTSTMVLGVMFPRPQTSRELVERTTGRRVPGLIVWQWDEEHKTKTGEGRLTEWSYSGPTYTFAIAFRRAVSTVARAIVTDPRRMGEEGEDRSEVGRTGKRTPMQPSRRLFGAMGSPFKNISLVSPLLNEGPLLDTIAAHTKAKVLQMADVKMGSTNPAEREKQDKGEQEDQEDDHLSKKRKTGVEPTTDTKKATQRSSGDDDEATNFWFVARVGRRRNWRRVCCICQGDEDETLACGCGHTETVMFRPCGHTMCAKPCFDFAAPRWMGKGLKPKTIMVGGQKMRIGNSMDLNTSGGFECPECRVVVTRTFQAEDVFLDEDSPETQELVDSLVTSVQAALPELISHFD